MPLRRLRYPSLEALLEAELVREEHAGTAALIRALRGVRGRGAFTRAEFLRMCRWKSPRARRLWEGNSPARIRAVSRRVLATRDERARMALLTELAGVGVPMASAILTLVDPRRYGVLDIRAWQLLFAVRAVHTNRRGQGFTVAQWLDYLAALRRHARRLGVTARTVEHTLFHCHRKFQHGILYGPLRAPAAPPRSRAGAGYRQGGAAPLRAQNSVAFSRRRTSTRASLTKRRCSDPSSG